MLSKMSRVEKTSDKFQEAFLKELMKGRSHRQALRAARSRMSQEPDYLNRRK
jgi:hypothetical protein